jgi:hypothetical protein
MEPVGGRQRQPGASVERRHRHRVVTRTGVPSSWSERAVGHDEQWVRSGWPVAPDRTERGFPG